jgi:hypothetical protein
VQLLQVEAGFRYTLLLAVCATITDFFLSANRISRACQREDWCNHKKHCGKEKVSKQLPGTANDPCWAFPEMPVHLRSALPSSQEGNIPVSSMGFVQPNSAHPYSPALQQQIDLLTADTAAEYFLFDEVGQPVRVVLPDLCARMAFRICRAAAWSNSGTKHDDGGDMAAMAQYLIKVMGVKPGLSRENILEQFTREYGKGAPAVIEKFEKNLVANGHGEETFIEMMSGNMAANFPKIKATRPRV